MRLIKNHLHAAPGLGLLQNSGGGASPMLTKRAVLGVALNIVSEDMDQARHRAKIYLPTTYAPLQIGKRVQILAQGFSLFGWTIKPLN